MRSIYTSRNLQTVLHHGHLSKSSLFASSLYNCWNHYTPSLTTKSFQTTYLAHFMVSSRILTPMQGRLYATQKAKKEYDPTKKKRKSKRVSWSERIAKEFGTTTEELEAMEEDELAARLHARTMRKLEEKAKYADDASTSLTIPEEDQQQMLDARRLLAVLQAPIRSPQVTILAEMQSFTEDVEKFFAEEHITPGKVMKLLASLAHKGLVDKANVVVQKLQKWGITITSDHYTCLVSACAHALQPEQALAYIKEMKKAGIIPTTATYNALLHAYAKSQQLANAFQVLPLMEADQVVPDAITYTELAHACVEVEDFERAWELFDTARINNLFEPDQVAFTVMIHCCAKQGRAERAFDLLQELEGDGLHPTEATFNAVLYACARRRDYYGEAFDVLNRMKEFGYIPDLTTMNTLLHASEKNGDTENAEVIVSQIEDPRFNYKPDVTTYTSLISTYARSQVYYHASEQIEKNIRAAEGVLERMAERGVQPNSYTITALLNVYCAANRLNRAAEFFNTRFEQYKVPKNEIAYNQMIRLYAVTRRPEKAFEMLDLLKKEHLKPTYSTYRWLIKACAHANYIKSGIKILQQMLDAGIKPQRKHVEPLIQRCLDEYPDTAKEIKEMVGIPLVKPPTVWDKMQKKLPRKGWTFMKP